MSNTIRDQQGNIVSIASLGGSLTVTGSQGGGPITATGLVAAGVVSEPSPGIAAIGGVLGPYHFDKNDAAFVNPVFPNQGPQVGPTLPVGTLFKAYCAIDTNHPWNGGSQSIAIQFGPSTEAAGTLANITAPGSATNVAGAVAASASDDERWWIVATEGSVFAAYFSDGTQTDGACDFYIDARLPVT